MKYEYRVLKYRSGKVEPEMNALGEQGFKLVGNTGSTGIHTDLIFMREIPQDINLVRFGLTEMADSEKPRRHHYHRVGRRLRKGRSKD